jgi:hypothetical protein
LLKKACSNLTGEIFMADRKMEHTTPGHAALVANIAEALTNSQPDDPDPQAVASCIELSQGYADQGLFNEAFKVAKAALQPADNKTKPVAVDNIMTVIAKAREHGALADLEMAAGMADLLSWTYATATRTGTEQRANALGNEITSAWGECVDAIAGRDRAMALQEIEKAIAPDAPTDQLSMIARRKQADLRRQGPSGPGA